VRVVLLAGRLREAVERLNPQVPTEAREEALRKVLQVESPTLVATNQAFHAMLRDGVEVEYRQPDGSIAGDRVRLVDFDDADMNDWLVTNQFTVVEAGHNCRPDIVVFVNACRGAAARVSLRGLRLDGRRSGPSSWVLPLRA
jgi:type I restriction enzyme R subunit